MLTDKQERPLLVMDADGFLRMALFETGPCDPLRYCHRPVIVTDEAMVLGDILHHMTVEPVTSEDDVIDKDIILFWSRSRRIITGADILGRLLRGIVLRKE